MKYILPAILGILFVFLVGLVVFEFDLVNRSQQQEPLTFEKLQDRQLVKVEISHPETPEELEKRIWVEVVKTPRSRAQGLSGRTEIGADGMLFLFDTSSAQYFWMKDMLFNIDMVWIQDGVVKKVTKDVPKPDPDTPDNRLETYPSDSSVNMVLEVKAGDSELFGLKPGATIQLVE